MVVEFQIALQRRCEFCRRPESRLADDLADAPVEALDHAVSLWMAWRNQPMLNAKLLAETIKDMVATGFPLTALAGETIRELAAVVGEQFDDLDGAGLFHFVQEIDATAVTLVGVDCHVDPACSAINGDEQITPLLLVGHLWQVLDIYM